MKRAAVARVAVFALAFLIPVAWAHDAGPPVVNANMVFHRVYVVGNGDSQGERNAFLRDLNTIRASLEQNGSQAMGSTTMTFVETSENAVLQYLRTLGQTAQAGETVTVSLIGHGNRFSARGAYTRLSVDVDDSGNEEREDLTSLNLRTTLATFRPGVNVVILADSCYGGFFSDDVPNGPNRWVIGPTGTCPTGAFNFFGTHTTTLSESMAAQASGLTADTNGDGVVSSGELQQGLPQKYFAANPPKQGKNKCDGGKYPNTSCRVIPAPPRVDPPVQISGTGFAAYSSIVLTVVGRDSIERPLGSTFSDGAGSFSVTADVADIPSLIKISDGQGNEDWSVVSAPFATAPLANDKIRLIKLTSPPRASVQPGGVYSLRSTFQNITRAPLHNLCFVTVELSGGAVRLENANLTVPQGSGAVLCAGTIPGLATFDIQFDLRLAPTPAAFIFRVDAFEGTRQ